MQEQSHILVVDDEKNYLLVLKTLLEDSGYTVTALNDPELALTFLEESEVDVLVTDMKMPRITGQEVLQNAKKHWPHLPVLIMTAFGSIEGAVEAMKYGAFDYISKPFSNDDLLLSIHNAAELSKAHRQYRLLQESIAGQYDLQQIIGRSQAIRLAIDMVNRAAPSRSNVLICGESGTGKELVAKVLHYTSPRQKQPFLALNCLNPNNLEADLFGSEHLDASGNLAIHRGKLEQLDGGTLFLDEISAINPDTQDKLLRLIQDRSFSRLNSNNNLMADVRIVAATSKDLEKLVEQGLFRDDLWYKLNVITIKMPPLRERREDILPLVAHFMEKVVKENNMPAKTFSTEALNYLAGYEWPGNIRQLENIVESCMVLSRGELITVEDLPANIRDEEAQFKSAVDLLPVQLDLAGTLEKIEAALIRRALSRADLVQVKAAELLGISKSLLQYKLKKYGITGH